MKKDIRIVLTGGVTGGHTYPLVAVLREAQKMSPLPITFQFVGPKSSFEQAIFDGEGIRIRAILTGKWRRYFSLQNLMDIFRLPIGFVQSLWYLFWFMPDAVFAKGGAASVPVVLAAWLYRIPVILHESDAVPGRANRFMARFASRVAVGFADAATYFPTHKTAYTGNPVRTELINANSQPALETLKLQNTKTLLVIGGSQGARVINEHILAILPQLLEKQMQVVHIVGSQNYQTLTQVVTKYGLDPHSGPYRPLPFADEKLLAALYTLATVVISRAGAGSIAELAANKKVTILIPLESAANNHQRANAYAVAQHGGATVLEEANLTEHLLVGEIDELLYNEVQREGLQSGIVTFYNKDAAPMIATALIELAVH